MSCPHTIISVLDLCASKLGSLEEFTVCLSKSLADRGWRSVLIFAGPVPDSIRPHFDETGAVIESIPPGNKLRRYRDLISMFRRYRPDVIHFHFFEFFSFLPILAWLWRPKLLAFTDHCRMPGRLGPLSKARCILWDRIVLRISETRILAVSNHVKKTLVDCFGVTPQGIQVVHNGVNVNRFVPLESREDVKLREELEIPPGASVVLSASDLRFEKGIDYLLLAAKHVLVRKPDTFFVIMGKGPLSESLQRQAQDLGIVSNVRFTGLRSDVHRFMAMANVIAVPSIWHEPAGLVVIEGMAAARPVVASRMGGIPEYLQDGESGILVEPKAPDQLADALLKLLNSPVTAVAMGRAGRKRVEEKFSMERWVGDVVQLYEKTVTPVLKA